MTFTTFDYSSEIETAVVAGLISTLQDDLGIVTIEVAKPQADGGPRAYRREALPAVYVSCEADGLEWIAALTMNLHYKVTVGVLTFAADPYDAHKQHEIIRQNVAALLCCSTYQGNATALASGATVWIDSPALPAPERSADKSPFTFHSVNTFRVRVPWTDPQGV